MRPSNAGGRWRLRFAGPIAVLLALVPVTDASAQLFQQLFGGGMPPPQAYRPPGGYGPYGGYGGYGGPVMMPPPGYRYSLPRSMPSPYRSVPDHGGWEEPERRTGSFRTVCVRLCDGYYWPLSHGVSRGSFYRDAAACRSGCGEEARLFYMPSATSDIDDAVDQTGRPYARLPTAYLYRKARVAGCLCRPEPWSAAELLRHERYALAEQPARQIPMDPSRPVRAAAIDALAEREEPAADEEAASAGTPAEPSGLVAFLHQRERPLAEPVERRQPRGREARRHGSRPTAISMPKPPPGGGWGQSKYTWPGDPPPKYR
jgi:hypothetical protein